MDFPRDKVDYFVVEKICLLKPYNREKPLEKVGISTKMV